MTLRRIGLRGFRNVEDRVIDLPPDGVAIVGENAQGKSNFLEALHYLDIFRSFRGSRDTALIRFGEELFRVEGELDREEPRWIAAAVQRQGPVKRITVDGEPPARIGDALGLVGSVLFTPDDVRLVSGGPQERRRFLDIVLSVNASGYLEALQRYRQILGQRNAALKDRGPIAGIAAWDALLAEAGGRVARMRAGWVARNSAGFRDVVSEVSGGEVGALSYEPGIPGTSGLSPEEDSGWTEALATALREGAERERRRGMTLFGPHRDELRLRMEEGVRDDDTGRDLREYGSGGQRRTAALALRILETETVLRRRGSPPLLLLDDVFAELDEARSERVMGLLERTAARQVILTVPREADVRFRHDRLDRWRITAGRIDAGRVDVDPVDSGGGI